MHRRSLSAEEETILAMVQREYGSHNDVSQVFFTDGDEAVIFAQGVDHTSQMMVNLSNLAEFRRNGIIPTDEDLIQKWLRR